ncbi:MAG: hypothetical protein K8F25_19605, partial [Fimbriimonadaceae bacterium]|nr:hypothetical protein [Alphaproteobacteria bacterium]
MTFKCITSRGIAAVAIALICSLTSAAVASETEGIPQLRENIIVEKSLVTLGDIFENAGTKA